MPPFDTKLATCASSIYALRTLKKHGLQPQQLHVVTRATTLNSLLYASPAWWGFASARDRERLERLVNKLRKGEVYLLFPPRSQKLIVAIFLQSRREQTTFSLICCPPERKPNTPSDPENTSMCYHTRTRVIFPHVFYMAIYIVERTEFLMEFMPFRYHKIRKEIFIFLKFPISNVFFVESSVASVSAGVFFVPIKRNCIVYCIQRHIILKKYKRLSANLCCVGLTLIQWTERRPEVAPLNFIRFIGD